MILIIIIPWTILNQIITDIIITIQAITMLMGYEIKI